MSKIIVYIGGFELPDKNAAAHRVLNNAKVFRELGYKVVFIGIDKKVNSITTKETRRIIQGFETYSVPYPSGGKSWLKYLINIREYTKIIDALSSVNMIILYNFQSIAMKRIMSYCRKKNIKCCADVTEWRSAKGENLIYRILKDADTWYRMKMLHKKMDGLIVISTYLQKYYSDNPNVVLIPTLIDTSEEKWIITTNKSSESLKLVYAGNPGLKDRLDILIKAVNAIKRDVKLDIIGLTKSQFLKYNPCLNEEANNPRITFHGRISHMEVLDYVKKANYSCFFRENDRVSNAGFPTKLAEAFSCHTPVITNDTSDISSYVINGKNGYLLKTLDESEMIELLEHVESILEIPNNLFEYRKYVREIHNFFQSME